MVRVCILFLLLNHRSRSAKAVSDLQISLLNNLPDVHHYDSMHMYRPEICDL